MKETSLDKKKGKARQDLSAAAGAARFALVTGDSLDRPPQTQAKTKITLDHITGDKY